MRDILCLDCGRPKPTPPDDAVQGLFPRRTTGKAKQDFMCDHCGKVILRGEDCVARSVPDNMGFWEENYLDL